MTFLRPVAQPGESVTQCYECGHKYNERATTLLSQLLNMQRTFCCVNCNAPHTSLADFEILVKADSEKFLNIETVRASVWYHATNNPNWDADIRSNVATHTPDGSDLMVHLGTEETARDRAMQRTEELFSETGCEIEEWFLFEVTLNEDALIHPDVQDDINCFPEHSLVMEEEEDWDWERRGVTRYVNAYECAGSVSLLANSSSFTVRKRRTL